MNLEVRAAEKKDLPRIKNLIDEYIAYDYYSIKELEACLQGDHNLFYAVTDSDMDDMIVSFFYACLSTLDEAMKILHVSEMPEELQKYGKDTLVGIYKTSSTMKAYQKHGICSSFIRGLEPTLQERGARMILATALHPLGRDVPMRHIFEKNGFTAIAEISRPWVDMFLYCPYCKRNHCICDAVFYMKQLDYTEDGEFL